MTSQIQKFVFPLTGQETRIGELPKGERVDELGAEMRVERKERR